MGSYRRSCRSRTPTNGGRWGVLALAGVLGICCLGFTAFAGGAAVVGGTVAGVTAASGAVTTMGGLLAVGVATALPLLVVGYFVTRRASRQ